jgi:hypothetical protein
MDDDGLFDHDILAGTMGYGLDHCRRHVCGGEGSTE